MIASKSNVAIVCLPHLVTSKNNLSNEYKKRIRRSFYLLSKLRSKKCYLILTGGKVIGDEKQNLSDLAEKYLISKFKIRNNTKILKEKKSQDTIGDAIYAYHLIKNKNISNIFIVSSDWHSRRAKKIFNKILGNKYTVNYSQVHGAKKYKDLERKNKSLDLFLDWSSICKDGNVKCIQKRMKKYHSLYN